MMHEMAPLVAPHGRMLAARIARDTKMRPPAAGAIRHDHFACNDRRASPNKYIVRSCAILCEAGLTGRPLGAPTIACRPPRYFTLEPFVFQAETLVGGDPDFIVNVFRHFRKRYYRNALVRRHAVTLARILTRCERYAAIDGTASLV